MISKQCVDHRRGDQSDFDALTTPDNNSIYYLLDSRRMFVGDKEFTRPILSGSTTPNEVAPEGSIYFKMITPGVVDSTFYFSNGMWTEIDFHGSLVSIRNKGNISSKESEVQTVATKYIVDNYGRQPKDFDGLIITVTDGPSKKDDKVLYIYVEESSSWINSGINDVDLSNYYTIDQTDTLIKKVETYVITLTEIGDGSYTSDRTYEEIKSAYDNNQILVVKVGDGLLPLLNAEINADGAGFTFGYTQVSANSDHVVTRAIHYLYSDKTPAVDEWTDATETTEYLKVVSTSGNFNRVYGIAKEGTALLLNTSTGADASTVAVRTGTGTLRVVTGTDKNDAVNVSQLNTKLDKVTSVTTYPTLYGKQANGTQGNYTLSTKDTASSVALRDADGTLQSASPTADSPDTTVTTKKYVEDYVSDQVGNINSILSTLVDI